MPVTIRSRLLLLVMALLLPVLLGVSWLISLTFDAERDAHARTLRDTTRALSMVVEGELAHRATLAGLLAQSPSLDGAPDLQAGELRLFELQARRALQDKQGWVELRGPQGTLLDTRWPDGVRPADTQDNATPAPLADEPTTQALVLDHQGGQAHAALVAPVVRQGRLLLNLVVTLRPAELQRIIDRQSLPSDWVASVLDNRGVVMARHPGGSAYVGRSATPDLVAAIARSREGLVESVTLDGMRAKAFFNTGPGGWTFVTGMPSEQFAGSMPTAVRQVMVGAALLLALAVLGALWVARRIAAPVHALKAAAAQLQAGLPVEPRLTGIVECDTVAVALAKASQTLQAGRKDLEHRVREAVERTRQAEQRISQSQRVEALGRLTGGVAHDVNNLLGIISNSAHLMQRHATTPELQMPVAATLRAVEAGSRLTQHLLRIAGRRAVRPQTVNLLRTLPELQDMMDSVLGRQVDVSVQVAPDTQDLHVDPSELELALINLALNARDAMTGPGEVRLRARNAAPDELDGMSPGNYVLITVSDDGAGMDSELAAHVFEPFFTTKHISKGTGLGLSQVHGFCVQCGGSARLASTPGLGTTVSMLLPAAPVGAPGAVGRVGAAAAAAAIESASTSSLGGLRVLLVEDNPDLADVTAQLLHGHGAQVVHADGAGEALSLLQGDAHFDVVLSDVVMPGPMDGVQLARKLRVERPGLPVVLISGYVAQRPTVRDFQVLSKPCSVNDLLAALEAAIASVPQNARLLPATALRSSA